MSLKNVLSCGLVISALRPKLNGWCRYIMHKEIAAADLSKRGFVGYGIERSSPGGYRILFAII